MDKRCEQQLGECYRLLEETGDIDLCLSRHPGFAVEIQAYSQIRSSLAELLPQPQPLSMAAGRRDLLSALAKRRQGLPLTRRLSYAGIAGGFAALTLMALAGLGVSAATGHGIPSPVDHILRDVGVGSTGRGENSPVDEGPGGEHGAAVSDAAQDARDATTPAAVSGAAASEAACTAAEDGSTLPSGAQGAPGQEGQTPPACQTAVVGVAEATATMPAVTPTAPAAEPPPATATPAADEPPDGGDSDDGVGPPNGKTPGPPNKTPGPPAGKTPPGQQNQPPGQQNQPPGQAQ